MNIEKEVKKAKKGNNIAFEKLIVEHNQVMYRVAKTIIKKDEDCADAIQEAILNAYRSISNLREPKYFKSWLLRIVINECYKLIRSRRKVVPLQDWWETNHGVEEKAYSAIETEMLLESLPHHDAQILTLFYINDISIKDISDILNIPESTVKTRLRRAKQKFFQTLTDRKEKKDLWKSGKSN